MFFDRVDDRRMLGISGSRSSFYGESRISQESKRVAEIVERLLHIAIMRGIAYCMMKDAVEIGQPIRVQFFSKLFEHMPQVSNFSFGRVLCGKARGCPFKKLAHRVELKNLLPAQLGYDQPTPRSEFQ